MSYKENSRDHEKIDEANIPKLPCARCSAPRKSTTLAYYGGMCEQCVGEYCRKPFQIPRRKQ